MTSTAFAGSVLIADAAAVVSLAAELDVAGALQVSAGTLAVKAGGSLDAGTLSVRAGGEVSVAHGVTLVAQNGVVFGSSNGVYPEAGVLAGAGIFETAGTTTINGNSDQYYNPGMDLQGDITWDNTGTVLDNGIIECDVPKNGLVNIVNAAGAVFDVVSGIDAIANGIYNGFGRAVFTNDGTLSFLAGGPFGMYGGEMDITLRNAGVLSIGGGQSVLMLGNFSNSGSVVSYGTLTLMGGGALGGVFGGPGTVVLAAGNYNVPPMFASTGTLNAIGANTMLTATGNRVLQAQFELASSATLALSQGADLTLSGGSLIGATYEDPAEAGYVLGAGTLTTSGTVVIAGAKGGYVEAAFAEGATWVNTGTVEDYGIIALHDLQDDHAAIVNAAGGTFILNGDGYSAGEIVGDSNSSLTNYGTLSSIDTLLTGYVIYCPVTNAGVLNVNGLQTGEQSNGTMVLEGGFTNAAAGTVNIGAGGALGLNGGGAIAGTVSGVGGGIYLSYGTYTVTSAAFGVSIFDNSATVVDSAAIELASSSRGTGSFVNEQGAVFMLTNGAAGLVGKSPVSVVNDGLIEKTGAGSVSAIDRGVVNNGTVSALSGTLWFKDGVTGTGSLSIGAGAKLFLGGSIGSGETIGFAGAGGTLALSAPPAALALSGFGVGDHLDLTGVVATGAAITGDTLTVMSAAGAFAFESAGLMGDGVSFGGDGHGGTVLTIGVGSQG